MNDEAKGEAGFDLPEGVELRAPVARGFEAVLTKTALAFVADLARTFEARRAALMEARCDRQAAWNAGAPAAPRVPPPSGRPCPSWDRRRQARHASNRTD